MAYKQTKPWRVRTQLLVAVNVPLGILLSMLLAWDYHREITLASSTKQANLENEAVAIHHAVAHLLSENDKKGVQSYLNSVCHRMRSTGADDHTILVDSHGSLFVSNGGHHHSAGFLESIRASSGEQITVGGATYIVGRDEQPMLSVSVLESLATARRRVRRSVLTRLAALAGVGLLAIVLVNAVVLRIIARPIRNLVRAVDSVRHGEFVVSGEMYHSREFAKLGAAVSLMSQTLRDIEARRRSQMEKAREIQQHLLPIEIAVPGLAISTWFSPAERVSGDYYDILPLPDGSWAIALADVSGHGVPSALEAAILKVLLGQATRQTQDPAEIIRFVNEHFTDTVPDGDFATAFLLRWIPGSSRAEYASAGHIPGLLRDSNGNVMTLDSTGMLIGIDKLATWTTQTIPLTGNDQFLVVSDGVTECHSRNDEMYGIDRLATMLGNLSSTNPDSVIQNLRKQLEAFAESVTMQDDVTAIAIQFESSPM